MITIMTMTAGAVKPKDSSQGLLGACHGVYSVFSAGSFVHSAPQYEDKVTGLVSSTSTKPRTQTSRWEVRGPEDGAVTTPRGSLARARYVRPLSTLGKPPLISCEGRLGHGRCRLLPGN